MISLFSSTDRNIRTENEVLTSDLHISLDIEHRYNDGKFCRRYLLFARLRRGDGRVVVSHSRGTGVQRVEGCCGLIEERQQCGPRRRAVELYQGFKLTVVERLLCKNSLSR